jgi:hypothetical protein
MVYRGRFPNGRFPENFRRNYHNAGQDFQHSLGNRLSVEMAIQFKSRNIRCAYKEIYK